MLRFIPTPNSSSISIGPLQIHWYALCLIAGIAVAIWLGDKRYRAMGGGKSVVADVAIVAVPAGIIGGRIYHVLTSPTDYFGKDADFSRVFKIWEGGLGIWGAISLGTLAAWIYYRNVQKGDREGVLSFAKFADALAPGILFAEAIGRLGNWFNGELFGKPTTLPWALEIPPYNRPYLYGNFETFHPTFLYEALWCVLIAVFILKKERIFRSGQVFTVYVAGYCFGRFFIEMLRIDYANHIFGLRVNVWVSAVLFLSSLWIFIKLGKRTEDQVTHESDTL